MWVSTDHWGCFSLVCYNLHESSGSLRIWFGFPVQASTATQNSDSRLFVFQSRQSPWSQRAVQVFCNELRKTRKWNSLSFAHVHQYGSGTGSTASGPSFPSPSCSHTEPSQSRVAVSPSHLGRQSLLKQDFTRRASSLFSLAYLFSRKFMIPRSHT